MNILYLCDEYPPGRHGGIGTAVQLLAREMVKKGHNVVVAGFCDWGYGGEDEFTDEGVKVYRYRRLLDSSWFRKKDAMRVRASYRLLKMMGLFQWDLKISLRGYEAFLERLISQHNIDIVEKPDFNEYMQYCTSALLFPVLSKPTVVKLHGTISYFLRERNIQPPQPLFSMEREVLGNAHAISSVSSYTAEHTKTYFDLDRNIEVLYNGITVPALPERNKVAGQVVYTGSLVEKKGIYQLMKAWNIVAVQMPEARLQVLGKGHREKAEAFLDQRSRRSVNFKGHVPSGELFNDLASSQVAVFPSYAETFGLAAAEAMAQGTATIFSTRTSGPEIVRDGIDGISVDPDDVGKLAEKILLLLRDAELRKAFEINGRKRVEDKFEIGKVADKNLAFYERVLATVL